MTEHTPTPAPAQNGDGDDRREFVRALFARQGEGQRKFRDLMAKKARGDDSGDDGGEAA